MTIAAFGNRLLLKTGSALLKRERWPQAAYFLERAVRLNPRHWESNNNLAIALLKLERWEEAAGAAQRAISLGPTTSDSHAFFGIALLKLERWEEAVLAYRRAITVDPKRFDSHERMGMALMRLKRWAEVAEAFRGAAELEPRSHGSLNAMGVALLELGRSVEAAAAFRRAIELAADDPAAAAELAGLLSNLASAVAHVEASEETARALRRAAALRPSAATHVCLGVELLKLERWVEAIAELEAGSAQTPALGGFHFLRVDPLVRLGRLQEAAAAHHQALTLGGPMPPVPGEPASTRFAAKQAAFWTAENLDPEVFEVEHWLHELSAVPPAPPPSPSARPPRLLFALDNDYGELTTLMYFVLGRRLWHQATLLLPDRLYAHNPNAIPGRTHRYESVDDILQAATREQPDVVFLCSAYLFSEHFGFTPDDLGRLIDQLHERGCRVVTADPFLGMLSKQDPRALISIDIPTVHPVWTVEQLTKAKRPAEERLWAGYTQAEQILRDTYHLYPSYCDVAEDDLAVMDARNVAFFNDRLVRPTLTTPERAAKPRWLFILTTADCDAQMLFEGETGFLDIVASKLVETLAAGRHPTLIGPSQFVEKLVARMPTAEGIDILSHCPFTQFVSLLLSAEHTFYWNVVSHSLLIRLYNQLPIVLFDRGHLVRNAPTIYHRVVGWYYQGWEPPFRDHREPLTLATVAGWGDAYRGQAARLVERYRRAPSPDEMVADLMGRAPTPGLQRRSG